jgi:hypothetical protein
MIMAAWPAGLVNLMSPLPPPDEDPLAPLRRSLAVFRASITPLMVPLVRQIEASTVAITASMAPLAQVMRQDEASQALIRRAIAPGTAFSDLWVEPNKGTKSFIDRRTSAPWVPTVCSPWRG